MANCAIHIKGTSAITYFIRDCIQTGRNYVGSNGSCSGVKEHLFDTKWTEDIANPVYDEEGHQIGYDRKVSDLKDSLKYENVVVSTKADVDKVTRDLIAAKYPDSDEKKIHRLKMSGGGEKEFKEYNSFVDDLVKRGKAFKDTMGG